MELEKSSLYSTSSCNSSCLSWWDLNGPQIPQSLLSKKFSFGSDQQQLSLLGCGLHHPDSSSSQSTGQSHREVPLVSTFSGSDNTDGSGSDGYLKSSLYLGTSEKLLPNQKLEYNHSSYAPFPFEDPYFGMMAACGPHSIVHPQLISTGQAARVPLPLDISGNELVYVNAKQYQAILRRRQSRAKLEAQNRPVQGRKPYLHESRHRHAMKRIRGAGGRFLNTKQLQLQQQQPQSQPNQCRLFRSFAPAADTNKLSNSIMLQLGGGWNLSESSSLKSDLCDIGTSTGDSGCNLFTVSSKQDLLLSENSQRFPYFHGGGVAPEVHSIL